MHVWNILKIGGRSLQIKNECVMNDVLVWPIIHLVMAMSRQQLSSEGGYRCWIVSMIHFNLLVGGI